MLCTLNNIYSESLQLQVTVPSAAAQLHSSFDYSSNICLTFLSPDWQCAKVVSQSSQCAKVV